MIGVRVNVTSIVVKTALENLAADDPISDTIKGKVLLALVQDFKKQVCSLKTATRACDCFEFPAHSATDFWLPSRMLRCESQSECDG